MTHTTWRDATRQIAEESGDPDAVVCMVWWAVIAIAALWAAGLYYFVCWVF